MSDDKIQELFEFLAHGDDDHRAWLLESLHAYFNGLPRPECR